MYEIQTRDTSGDFSGSGHLFDAPEEAEEVYDELVASGVGENDLRIVYVAGARSA